MKKLLNTLYMTSENGYLGLDGETIVVYDEEKVVGKIPLHNLEGIVSFGYRGTSPALMGASSNKSSAIFAIESPFSIFFFTSVINFKISPCFLPSFLPSRLPRFSALRNWLSLSLIAICSLRYKYLSLSSRLILIISSLTFSM